VRAPRVRATVPVTAAAAGCYYLVILTGSVAVSGPAAPGRSAYSTAATKLAARAGAHRPGPGPGPSRSLPAPTPDSESEGHSG
jgi:hypothetical protein